MVKSFLKKYYFLKIKRMSPMEYRLHHLRKIGMTIGEDCWFFQMMLKQQNHIWLQ